MGQVHAAVQALLPEVAYNAPARILTLRASGARKQPRLPGARTGPGSSPSSCPGSSPADHTNPVISRRAFQARGQGPWEIVACP